MKHAFYFKNNQLKLLARHDRVRVLDPPHIHDHLQVWYVHEGSFIHNHCGQDIKLYSGAVAIVPAWCQHFADARHATNDVFICNLSNRLFASEPENRSSWCFSNICLDPLTATISRNSPIFYPRAKTLQEIFSLNYELTWNSQEHNVWLIPLLRGKTAELMSLLAEEYAASEGRLSGSSLSDYCPSIHHALKYIHKNYRTEITRESIAQLSMMSTRSFTRIFKGILGMTLVEYLQYLRIMHAQMLLSHTDRTVWDVAGESGFRDLSYFQRVFKRSTGCTPQEYRRHARGPHPS